jgi:hypothetical protein
MTFPAYQETFRPTTVSGMIHQSIRRQLALRYHAAIPQAIRSYLNARGVPDSTIADKLLGWNGRRITIPVFDQAGDVIQFRYARSPSDSQDTPKVLTEVGGGPELYGLETLANRPYRVVICEGEFDRLVLESRGFAAVTSTAGANTFLPEWAAYFGDVKRVYICFDRDEAGDIAARRVNALLPQATIVHLPDIVGPKGDVTDYFVRLGHGITDFEILLAFASTDGEEELGTLPAAPPPGPRPRSGMSASPRVARLKRAIRLVEIVGQLTDLHATGERFVGLCPFHHEMTPSFTIYPATDTYFCFGCRAHGDLISFVMQKHSKTFAEAVQALERYFLSHEL